MIHPLQGHKESTDRLADIFRAGMEKRGILPKNPLMTSQKTKGLAEWLKGMGGRFRAANTGFLTNTDPSNFFSFPIKCPAYEGKKKYIRYRQLRWIHVEIPWDLADKVLTLGHLP